MKAEKKKDRLNIKFEDITLREIYAFMEGGNPDNAPKEIVEYLELMDKIRGMHLRIDRYGSHEAIIRHLITVENIPRLKARRIYEETLEYFYCDSYVSKKAWRNIYAGMVDKAINFIFLTMKDPNDALKVVNALM